MLFSASPHLYTSAYELAEVNDPAERAAVGGNRGHVTASRSNSVLFTGPYRPPTLFGTVAAIGFFAMSMGFTLSICSFIVFSTSRFWASALGRGGLVLLVLGSLLLAISVLHHFCKAATRKLILKRLEAAGSLGRVCCRSLRAACCPVTRGSRGGGNASFLGDDPGIDDQDDASSSCCADRRHGGLAADGAQMLLAESYNERGDEADMQLGGDTSASAVLQPGAAAAAAADAAATRGKTR